MSAKGRQRERTRDTLVLIFAISGGASAWTLQLWLSWVVGDPVCFIEGLAADLAGMTGALVWLGIGVATGGLALAALVVSIRLWRGSRGDGLAEEPSPDGPRRFLLYVALMLNSVLLLTIVMGLTAPLFLEACS